jgi:hypothetical protein
MIQFLCPTCDSTLSVAPRKSGTFCNCPKCRQRLQVPTVPRSSTASGDTRIPTRQSRPALRKVLTGLRFGAWAAAVAWVGVVAWSSLSAADLSDLSGWQAWLASAPTAQLFGAYIVARAIDSVSRR